MIGVVYQGDLQKENPDWKTNPRYVFVGEGSPWGGPFYPMRKLESLDGWKVGCTKQVERWQRWFNWQSDLLSRLPELLGKILVVDYQGENTHAHRLADMAIKYMPQDKEPITDQHRKHLFALINPYCGKNRAKRLRIVEHLLLTVSPDWQLTDRKVTSFNDLTEGDWQAIRDFAYPGYYLGDWTISEDFEREVKRT